jgi:hypothetical protein
MPEYGGNETNGLKTNTASGEAGGALKPEKMEVRNYS